MKKLITLALLAVVMAGCEETKKPSPTLYRNKKTGIITAIIDNCEYIVNKEKCAYAIAGVISTNAQFKKEPASEELEKVVEEIVDPTVLNAYGVKEIANRLRRTMIESVSEDLKKAAFDNAQKNYKEGFRGAAMQAFNEGADWRMAQMMKDAIDTTIKQGCTELVILIKGLNEDKFSFGDKVKIIVVKED